MYYKIETISPAVARVYLEKNVGNRPKRAAVINGIARAIKANAWLLTHQGIAFDKEGRLVDGQHRLEGVIAAGKSIDTVVFYDVDPKTFDVIDNYVPHKIHDDIVVSALLRSVVRFCYNVSKPGVWDTQPILEAFDNEIQLVRGGINEIRSHYDGKSVFSGITASVSLFFIAIKDPYGLPYAINSLSKMVSYIGFKKKTNIPAGEYEKECARLFDDLTPIQRMVVNGDDSFGGVKRAIARLCYALNQKNSLLKSLPKKRDDYFNEVFAGFRDDVFIPELKKRQNIGEFSGCVADEHLAASMSASVVTVTPEMASEWLKMSKKNRTTYKLKSIDQISRAMSSGLWILTHQGIAFDWDGCLIDGGKRLTAVVRSGASVDFYVFKNVPRENAHAIDRGETRSLSDVLRLTPTEAAALNYIKSSIIRGKATSVSDRVSDFDKYKEAFIPLWRNITENTDASNRRLTGVPVRIGVLASMIKNSTESEKILEQYKIHATKTPGKNPQWNSVSFAFSRFWDANYGKKMPATEFRNMVVVMSFKCFSPEYSGKSVINKSSKESFFEIYKPEFASIFSGYMESCVV